MLLVLKVSLKVKWTWFKMLSENLRTNTQKWPKSLPYYSKMYLMAEIILDHLWRARHSKESLRCQHHFWDKLPIMKQIKRWTLVRSKKRLLLTWKTRAYQLMSLALKMVPTNCRREQVVAFKRTHSKQKTPTTLRDKLLRSEHLNLKVRCWIFHIKFLALRMQSRLTDLLERVKLILLIRRSLSLKTTLAFLSSICKFFRL